MAPEVIKEDTYDGRVCGCVLRCCVVIAWVVLCCAVLCDVLVKRLNDSFSFFE